MAIKLELSELQRISGRTSDINEELAHDLSEMVNELNNICSNVQSSELTSANENLTNAIESIAEAVKKNLPEIIAFLNKQIEAYGATNETTKAAIDNLISSINDNFGTTENNSNINYTKIEEIPF